MPGSLKHGTTLSRCKSCGPATTCVDHVGPGFARVAKFRIYGISAKQLGGGFIFWVQVQ